MIHEGEVHTDVEQIRRLLAAQFPQWAGRPITRLPPVGTDHTLYRLGADLLARLPRIDWAIDQAESDHRWLPVLAPWLPLPIPVPIAVGEPGEGFPWPWTVVPWIVGETPTRANVDLHRSADQLGEFVAAMGRIDPTGGTVKVGESRGVPLANRDQITRAAIAELGDRVDTARVTAAWDRALEAPVWTEPPVWLHGDLQPGNLLARDRELCAVIDFGGLGLGDPAVELMPAWDLFDARSRAVFRAAAGRDDAAWERGKGWALSTALIGLPYYWHSAPHFVAEARLKIAAVLSED